jgi:hypothetical protein
LRYRVDKWSEREQEKERKPAMIQKHHDINRDTTDKTRLMMVMQGGRWRIKGGGRKEADEEEEEEEGEALPCMTT